MRNEKIRLPFFLRYYRNLGVNHFLIVDNDSTDGTRSDSIATGETLVRVGLTGHLEAQVGWDGWSHHHRHPGRGRGR